MFAYSMAAAAASIAMTAPGPKGPLAGTYLDAGKGAPVVLMLPGSGPTDRDGNNPLGVTAAPYRLLAEALASKGVSTVRIDKRGAFGSKGAVADGNAVTIEDYASDTHSWIGEIRKRTGAKCVWVLGHSEGGLVALVSAQNANDICGLVLVSSPGRKMGTIIREQLQANPGNKPILPQALAALSSLEAGKLVDASTIPAPLMVLFSPKVQPFLMNMLKQDPAALAAHTKVPMLVVQGDNDLQVALADANALHAAQPKSELVVVAGMNHVLKDVPPSDTKANFGAYADPSLPVDTKLVDSVAEFVKQRG